MPAPRTYPLPELRRAHTDLSTTFIEPGPCMPADFDEALSDELWSRLLNARAANNRYKARLQAKTSPSRIEYTQGDRHESSCR